MSKYGRRWEAIRQVERLAEEASPRRGDHPSFQVGGSCSRCGCGRSEKRCPPGYWMTKTEIHKWSAATVGERDEMEDLLGSGPTKGLAK